MKPVEVRAVAADLDVVEHAHAVEQGDVLEGAADAELGDDVARLRAGSSGPRTGCRPRWGCRAGERQLKSVVLPAPLGPIRPAMLARRHVEGDAVERDDAAEAHGNIAHAQQAAGVAGSCGRVRNRVCATIDGRIAPCSPYFDALVLTQAPPVGLSDRQAGRY